MGAFGQRAVGRLAGALGLSLFLSFASAQAAVVERVVAVVGDKPILLSELRRRARPDLLRTFVQTPDANVYLAVEGQILRRVLKRMIEERLEEIAAEKARINVRAEEIDRGAEHYASMRRTTVAALIAELAEQGITEQDFRDEVRRQLLEEQLVLVRVRPRVRVAEQDARAAYQRFLREVDEQKLVDARTLVVRVKSGNEAESVARVEEIAKRARRGDDFCGLVEKYTEDDDSRATCGSRGFRPLGAYLGPMREVIVGLRPMEVSEPLRVRAPEDAFLIILRMPVPTFEQVKGEMQQRALLEGLERQRALWLEELKRTIFVESRF